MRYEPQDAAVDVYRFWRERNGGQRRSTVGPAG
jgi:guanine deaminase